MDHTIERTTMRKVFLRLIPLLFCAMFLNYLDRFNLGFAALRMNHALHFSPSVFGFGASLFFFGYMLLGLPSNLVLHRLGARRWVGCILIAWGTVAVLTGFIWNEASFFGVRVLLGMIEAGFLPGVALYVTYWFPAAYRARAVAGYIIAGQLSAVIGAPVSGFIMTYMNGALGLQSWQWMFVVEGAPTIILGALFIALLTDRPANARWLSDDQRAWLQERLTAERRLQEAEQGASKLLDVLRDGRVWSLAALFGCALVGVYGMLVWLPQIVNAMGHMSLIEVGFLSALPPLLGAFGQLLFSYTSDRTGDRKFHLGALYLVAAIALAASALAPTPAIAYAMLCIVGFCMNSGNPLFWSLSASLMTGVAGAGAIAFVNSVAQFGGLIGPWMIGLVKGATGSFAMSLMAMAAFLLIASLIAFLLRVTPARRTTGVATEAVLAGK